MSATITLTSHNLRQILTKIIPFASADWMFPELNAVHLFRRGDYLIAVATDRYRLGMARVPHVNATGRFRATMRVPELKAALAAMPRVKGSSDLAVTLTHHPGEEPTVMITRDGLGDSSKDARPIPKISLSVGDLTASLNARSGWTKSWPATVQQLVTKTVRATVDPKPVSDRLNFDPAFLASFAGTVTTRGAALVIAPQPRTTTERVQPTLVYGDDFVGLLMPMNSSGSEEDTSRDRGWSDLLAVEPE